MSEEVEPSQYIGPKEFVHLHLHSLFSSLDGIPSAEQYADACLEYGHPAMAATEHGHMASLPDMYFAFKKRGLKYVAGCFLPDQKILTDSDVVNIQDIKINNNVFTHKGRFKTVTNVQKRDYEGDVVRISAWSVEDQISTPEHPYLVREVTCTEVSKGVWEETITTGWKKACDIERNKDRSNKHHYKHYLCVPRLPSNSEIKYIDISNIAFLSHARLDIKNGVINRVIYESGDYKSSYDVGLPVELLITNEFLWIAGLWLAKGSFATDNGQVGALNFSLGGDEEHFVERIKEYFEQFNINISSRRRDDATEFSSRYVIDIVVYSSFFVRIFYSLFSGATKKKIPTEWLLRLSPFQSKMLLDGLFDGDAKLGEQQSTLKLCNETLVWQARLLMTKLPIPQYSAITIIKNKNPECFGSVVVTTTNDSYSIRRRENGCFYCDYDNEYIYLPVYEVKEEAYVGNVYNFEVKDDNSYFTGVAVHNCEIYYNDYEPLRRELDAQGIKPKAMDEDLRLRVMRNRHLTILAKNAVGISNLIKLTTLAFQWGLYYKPRIWFEKLCEYKEGLIVLSGCVNGPLAYELRLDIAHLYQDGKRHQRVEGRDLTAGQYLKKFKEVFGDDFFIEVQMPCLPELYDIQVFYKLIEMADMYGVKPVISNDCHYLTRKDAHLQKIMMAIEQKTNIYDPNLFYQSSDEQYFKSRADLWATFKNNGYSKRIDDSKFEELCDNTLLIADRCEKLNPDTSPKIPNWSDVEPGINANNALRDIVYEQLHLRGWDKNTEKWSCDGREVTYLEQAEIELARFIDKGFSSYFLITRDWIQWGRSNGWPFGPRGCTTPDSLIDIDDNQQKKIEDIQIGDKIQDGFGDEQTVENKFIYDVSEELFVFELDNKTISITADHKLYVVRDGLVMLLPASEIKDTDEIIGNLQDQQATSINGI
jgi:hypothetical protein